jgi:putative hemolysin
MSSRSCSGRAVHGPESKYRGSAVSGFVLAAAAGLLLLSAVISAAESAAFTVGDSRLRTLLEEGFRGADNLARVREREASVRASTFLVNTGLNVAAGGLLVLMAAELWGIGAAWVAVPVATAGILTISEGAPRFVAGHQAIRVALLSSPLLLVLDRLAGPLLRPFVRLEALLSRRNGEPAPSRDEREVRALAELGRREGVVEEEEHLLVERAFRMDELCAWDVMTPRVDIFAWKASLRLEEIVPQLQSVPYSRVPVYGESIDDITGVLYVREAYEAFVAGHRGMELAHLSREPFFVPGSLSLPRLLQDFQARRIHMGIVADEFGGTDGLVTLEDVIEELVGEIEDETDIAEESIVRVSRDEMVVEGGVELREVNYVFNVSLPHLEHRSLNGFVLEELGRVPEAGEKLELPGLDVEILEATETQVTRARLRKHHGVPAPEAETEEAER